MNYILILSTPDSEPERERAIGPFPDYASAMHYGNAYHGGEFYVLPLNYPKRAPVNLQDGFGTFQA